LVIDRVGSGGSGAEKPATEIAAFRPWNATDFFGSHKDAMPSFHACTLCLATGRQRRRLFWRDELGLHAQTWLAIFGRNRGTADAAATDDRQGGQIRAVEQRPELLADAVQQVPFWQVLAKERV
jgi:hypothetical protein